MREVNFLQISSVVAVADATDVVVHSPTPSMREDDGLVERRRIERGGRVAQMMLAETAALRPIEIGLDGLELVGEQRLLKQLFPQPQRQRHRNDVKPRGAKVR